MYAFLSLLLLFLLYSVQNTEAFTVHVEGVDVITPLQASVNALTTGIREKVTRPLYRSFVSIIPYRHHYRKLRRQFQI
jgi:hypothetical protein